MRYLFTLLLFSLCIFHSCTPDKHEYIEMGYADLSDVTSIKMRLSHRKLLADGEAQITFCPVLTTKQGYILDDSKIDYSLIEFYTTDNTKLTTPFAINNKEFVGKELMVYAKLVGMDVMSDTVKFEIISPNAQNDFKEYTIPIVFHVMQYTKEVNDFGGDIAKEQVYKLINKLNNVFGGKIVRTATGVNCKLKFEPAKFNPDGSSLYEDGINRIIMDDKPESATPSRDYYNNIIETYKALWPHEHYLNVWLISSQELKSFQFNIGYDCKPNYYDKEVTSIISGLNLDLNRSPLLMAPPSKFVEVSDDWQPRPHEVGIMYRLQSIFMKESTAIWNQENEFTHSVGAYYGLIRTWTSYDPSMFEGMEFYSDFCNDTHRYYADITSGTNNTPTKLVDNDYYFLSENIMDDPTGMHRSITLDQAKRIHWVLRNCPGRKAWKSSFALQGY